MAEEQTPVTPQEPNPAAPEELTQLKSRLEAAEKAVEESRRGDSAKDREIQQLREAYQRDVAQLVAYAQQQQVPQAQATEEDEDGFVSKRDLKRLREELAQAHQQGIGQAVSMTEQRRLQDQRELHRSLAKQNLPEFTDWEADVERLLDSQPIEVASKPGAYAAALKLVQAQNLDKVIEKRMAEREARRALEAQDAEVEETGFEPEPSPRRPAAPVPVSSAIGQRTAVRRARIQPLSEDEKIAAEMFGVESADEWRKWSDPNYQPDILGMKGRKRA